jgi:hypothetical protein
VTEIGVEGGAGDAATIRDLLERDGMVPLLGEQAKGLLQNIPPACFMIDDNAHNVNRSLSRRRAPRPRAADRAKTWRSSLTLI